MKLLENKFPIRYIGTTTVGLACKDGVVLAADRRVSDAYNMKVAHKVGKKILQIDDHLIAAVAGAVADAQFVIDQLKAHSKLYKLSNNRPISTLSIANFAAILMYSSRAFPYYTELILGGYDSKGPTLCTIDLLGSLTVEKYISRGSGSPYALGVLESKYSPDISIEEGIKIALEAIQSSLKWDLFTGEGIDVAYVSEKGVVYLTPQELAKLMPSVR